MFDNETNILPADTLKSSTTASYYLSKTIVKFAFTACISLSLIACDKSPKSEEKEEAVVETSPDQIASGSGNRSVAANDQGATPMLERVAIMALLNKRTGESRTFELNPDKSIRFGNVVVKVQACERTAPWETYPDIGAFTQLFVKERPPGTNDSEIWRKVFSGWLHKNNPAQNVVEHPIYDVWVKDCIMLFPGETTPPKEDISLPGTQEIIESSPNQSARPRPSTPSAPEPPSAESSAPESSAPEPTLPETPELETEPAPEEAIEEGPIESEEFIELDDLVDSDASDDEE